MGLRRSVGIDRERDGSASAPRPPFERIPAQVADDYIQDRLIDATRIASLHYPELSREAAEMAEEWRRADALRRLLRRHLPAASASLFARAEPIAAEPGRIEGRIDWYSDLAGEPVPLADLPDGKRKRALDSIEDRLNSIRRLAGRLDAAPDFQADAGEPPPQLLLRAARYPHPSCVYLVGGEPVLTYWGLAPPTKGAGAGPVTALPRPVSAWRRWRPALLVLAVLGIAAALAAGAWHTWQGHLRAELEQDLAAGLAANCAATSVLQALHQRLGRIDPGGKRFPALRVDTQRELDRCADAADLDADLAAARDDCAALPAIADALLDQDVARPPMAAIKARLDDRLALCGHADALAGRLGDARGDCEAIAALEQDTRALDARAYPLADPVSEIAAEAAACRLADSLAPQLSAAEGDCLRLREIDRELRQRVAAGGAGLAAPAPSAAMETEHAGPRPAPLDASRPALASLRGRLDAGLGRCDLADHLAHRLVVAQGDCVELTALRETIARRGDAGPPFAELDARIDEALGHCAALSELESRFAHLDGDCEALAAFAGDLARWRDNLRFADIRARVIDAEAICTQADELERRIADAGLNCDALRALEPTLSRRDGPQFEGARRALAAKLLKCARLGRYTSRLAEAGSHCGRLKALQRDLRGESGSYLKTIRQRLTKALQPCRPKPKPATRARGAGAYALRGACNGSLTISPAGGYHHDRVRHVVRISPPVNLRIGKVVSDNRGCRNCRLHKRNATTWSIGLFYNCSGRGKVPISYSAYDRNGRLVCSGKGVARCLGRHR